MKGIKNESRLTLGQPSNQSLYSLQSHLVAMWTHAGVDEYYRSVFLAFLDELSQDQAKQQIIMEQKLMLQNRSNYHKIKQCLEVREEILEMINPKLSDEAQIESLCENLDRLRKINLNICEEVLKIKDFLRKRGVDSLPVCKAYNKLFQKLNTQNTPIKQSYLSNYVPFAKGYDPFFLFPYENSQKNGFQSDTPRCVIKLFSMNISYVYRLMKIKNQLLNCLSFASSSDQDSVYLEPKLAYIAPQKQANLQLTDIKEECEETESQQAEVMVKNSAGLKNRKYFSSRLKSQKKESPAKKRDTNTAETIKIFKTVPIQHSGSKNKGVKLPKVSMKKPQKLSRKIAVENSSPIFSKQQKKHKAKPNPFDTIQSEDQSDEHGKKRIRETIFRRNRAKNYKSLEGVSNLGERFRFENMRLNSKKDISLNKNQNEQKRDQSEEGLNENYSSYSQQGDINYEVLASPSIRQNSKYFGRIKKQKFAMPATKNRPHQLSVQAKKEGNNKGQSFNVRNPPYDKNNFSNINAENRQKYIRNHETLEPGKLQNKQRQLKEKELFLDHRLKLAEMSEKMKDLLHQQRERQFQQKQKILSERQKFIKQISDKKNRNNPEVIPNQRNVQMSEDQLAKMRDKIEEMIQRKKIQRTNQADQLDDIQSNQNNLKRSEFLNNHAYDQEFDQMEDQNYPENNEQSQKYINSEGQPQKKSEEENKTKQFFQRNRKTEKRKNPQKEHSHEQKKNQQNQTKIEQGEEKNQQSDKRLNQKDEKGDNQPGESSNLTISKKQIVIKPCSIGIEQLLKLIKTSNIPEGTRKKFETEDWSQILFYKQCYFTQFYFGEEFVSFGISTPLNNGNYEILYWAMLNEGSNELGLALMQKYLQYLQNFTSLDKIYIKVDGFESFGFVKVKNGYARNRTGLQKKKLQLSNFLTVECSNICFQQQSKDFSILYSVQIPAFKPDDATVNCGIAFGQKKQIQGFLPKIKIAEDLSQLSEVNSLLESWDLDDYEVSPELKVGNCKLVGMKELFLVQYPFSFQDRYFMPIGEQFLLEGNKVFFLPTNVKDYGLYFGKNFPGINQFVQACHRASSNREKKKKKVFAFKIFTKQLYGRLQNDQFKCAGCYGNWDITFAWQNQLKGLVKKPMPLEEDIFGPDSYFVAFFNQTSILYAVKVDSDDYFI